jgi:hypothetical protein
MNNKLRSNAIEMLNLILDNELGNDIGAEFLKLKDIDKEVLRAAKELVKQMGDVEILSFGEGDNRVTVSQIPGTDSYAAYKAKFTNGAAFCIGSRDGVIESAKSRAGLKPEKLSEDYAWFARLSDEEKGSLKDAAGVPVAAHGGSEGVVRATGAKKVAKPRKRRTGRSISLGD